MAIYPPKARNWWKQPIAKTELVWIAVAFIWGLVMFFTMVFWHVYGDQNLSNESYRITPEHYVEKVDAMVEAYTLREEGETGIPVVHPPIGADVYMVGRQFEWYPILELEKDRSYRLHLSSYDVQHGFSLQPTGINLQVHPGYEMVLTMTPDQAGQFSVICNEFCGLGHHLMVGRIYIVDAE